MKFSQKFTVDRQPDAVWGFLSDVQAVSTCVPGLELIDQRDDGTYLGRFTVKVGPLVSKLEGEGVLRLDDPSRRGTLEGKGVDKRGGSRAKGSMSYAVVADGEGSSVEIESDFTLSGPLAQIGRTGIIEDVAQILIREFAANLRDRLAKRGEKPAVASEAGISASPQAGEFDAGSAIKNAFWRRVLGFFKRIFG